MDRETNEDNGCDSRRSGRGTHQLWTSAVKRLLKVLEICQTRFGPYQRYWNNADFQYIQSNDTSYLELDGLRSARRSVIRTQIQ